MDWPGEYTQSCCIVIHSMPQHPTRYRGYTFPCRYPFILLGGDSTNENALPNDTKRMHSKRFEPPTSRLGARSSTVAPKGSTQPTNLNIFRLSIPVLIITSKKQIKTNRFSLICRPFTAQIIRPKLIRPTGTSQFKGMPTNTYMDCINIQAYNVRPLVLP